MIELRINEYVVSLQNFEFFAVANRKDQRNVWSQFAADNLRAISAEAGASHPKFRAAKL